MIPILKDVITHDHDTKLSRRRGEDATISRVIRPSPKEKSFKEDPEDTLTHGWGNRPNLGKDHTLAHGLGNRPNPKKDFARIKV